MQFRRLGKDGPSVSALGLGCMGMSQSYGSPDAQSSADTFARALELGINFFDTANAYGQGANETLLAPWIAPVRDKIFLATKVGITGMGSAGGPGVCAEPEYIREQCDASLARLGVDVVDLYYLHRVDPNVPIEDSIGAMSELVQAGKVRYLGVSEISASKLRRAHTTHPVAAVQSEYSLWTRDPEDGVLDCCRELGVAFVPFSPLGRAMLTATVNPEQLSDSDMRKRMPRFSGDNYARNQELILRFAAHARERDCTPAQLALAWLLKQGQDIIPIPGTKRVKYLEENLGALELNLSDEEEAQLRNIIPRDAIAGERYGSATMALVDKD